MEDKSIKLETDDRWEALSRENTRLRGDLMTVARRLSHDLRTPLSGIISSGEAIKESLAEVDPTALPIINSTLDSAEELSQLIKRSSFVLKATAAPQPSEPMEMGEAVTNAIQRLELRILRQGAIVDRPESWPGVNGVPAWMEVIWWNLVVNALQHAKTEPVRVELGVATANGVRQFYVSDNGQGVAPARQRQLFQPFDKLHEAEAAPGLGLSIVHRLLELQGGTCGYRPTSHGGACFFFELP